MKRPTVLCSKCGKPIWFEMKENHIVDDITIKVSPCTRCNGGEATIDPNLDSLFKTVKKHGEELDRLTRVLKRGFHLSEEE